MWSAHQRWDRKHHPSDQSTPGLLQRGITEICVFTSRVDNCSELAGTSAEGSEPLEVCCFFSRPNISPIPRTRGHKRRLPCPLLSVLPMYIHD